MRLSLLLKMIPGEIERALVEKAYSTLSLRPSSAPFLSGDTFRSVADFIFDETGGFDPKRVEAGSVVYLGVGRMREFVENMLPELAAPVVLLSHQDDLNIDASYRFLAEHRKVGHWFAKNCLLNHDKVTPLPIGLEDRRRHNSGALRDFRRLRDREPPSISRVAFAFSLGTNVEKRVPCYVALKRSPCAVELAQPLNGALYRRYVSAYRFVASPSGNGLDCHRTWETLYMGAVPVAEDNSMNRYFAGLGLPLLLVNNWEEVVAWDEAFLERSYAALMAKANFQPLYIEYWLAKIAEARAKVMASKVA